MNRKNVSPTPYNILLKSIFIFSLYIFSAITHLSSADEEAAGAESAMLSNIENE
tara:strand:+ start:238 stop:399 length:162 start_codon:yes stop_codon:yes gene_type:complete